MACYHPLWAIKLPRVDKPKVFAELEEPPNFYIDEETGEMIEPFQIPCGRCIGCRLEYSRQWANRCVMESMSYPKDQSWFVTLTIDDEHLEVTSHGFATVKMDDVTKFMKALRQHWQRAHGVSDNIRFYAASEYGDESMRPHYHVLIFGLPLYDLKKYSNNHQGDVIYTSEELDSVWKKGSVKVAEFNWNTAAYTARYVMKKVKGMDAGVYQAMDIEPERVRMSRCPGIGAEFLSRHKDYIYHYDQIVLPSSGGKAHAVAPPKYFDRKIKEIDPDFFERLKSGRKARAEVHQQQIEQELGYDPIEYRRNQEEAKTNSMLIFRRKGEL